MATGDTDANHFQVVEQETKALWAALDMPESRMDRKMDQKLASLTKDIRQMFTEQLGGGLLNHNLHQQTPRGFAHGRGGGGRGEQFRRSLPNFEDDLAGNNGEIPIHTSSNYSNHFEDEGEEPFWNITPYFPDPNQIRQRTTHPRTASKMWLASPCNLQSNSLKLTSPMHYLRLLWTIEAQNSQTSKGMMGVISFYLPLYHLITFGSIGITSLMVMSPWIRLHFSSLSIEATPLCITTWLKLNPSSMMVASSFWLG